MTHARRFLVVHAALGLTACATTNTQTDCSLSDTELAQVKANAYAFLPEEWPVADKNCEQISDDVSLVAPGKCAISGGPTMADGCAESNHEGFSVVFDRETLEAEDVKFKVE